MRHRNFLSRRDLWVFAGLFCTVSVASLRGRATARFARKKLGSSRRDGQSQDKDKDKDKDKKSSGKNRSRDKKGASRSSGGPGDAIVREALKHKGARYVWAGASPNGFDCSGFTWYVYDKVTGIDIGRTVKEQYTHGNAISRDSLRPGDIVFFKNTSQKGLSHCGIYVSASEFIHAENETTGVIISSLDSDYYSQHYAGARRIV